MPPANAVLDNFDRADAASLGASWNAPIFANWPTFSVVSNQASNVATAFRSNYWATSFAADQELFFTLASAEFPRTYLRLTNPGGQIGAYEVSGSVSLGQIHVFSHVAGARTKLGADIFQALAVNDGIWATVEGSTIKVYHRPGLAGAWTLIATRTDTAVTGAGFIGFAAHNSASFLIDDFGGGILAAAGGPALNANVSIAANVKFRPRFVVQEKNGVAIATGFELWFSKNSAAYAKVTTATDLRSTTSAQFTDGAATTNVLAAGMGTFAAGAGDTDGAVASISVGASGRTEIEWALIIPTGTVGDTYDLQMRRAGGTALDLYTQTPRITVA